MMVFIDVLYECGFLFCQGEYIGLMIVRIGRMVNEFFGDEMFNYVCDG